MYYIASKNNDGSYYIDEVLEDWHDAVDRCEPIDCINGEMVIYDQQGHKYFVGPNKDLKVKKLFWKISTVDVSSWNFNEGEPFLTDTHEIVPDELQGLLKTFNERK